MTKDKEIRVTKGVALTEKTWGQLSDLAKKEGRSRNNYMEQIILQHLKQLEQNAKA
ncbi:hypothetical protein [Persicobacter psychrovividus]|uniref:Ribbon-helix-helix protein CopG domain-containing protein n=1 Tax=Persicobacter psychrovividus TaxID=387638 RepID=A0ABN6LKY8_9BACT|nr:hypothetical protein PEPS_45470 [Persicobacter psychrovividus]